MTDRSSLDHLFDAPSIHSTPLIATAPVQRKTRPHRHHRPDTGKRRDIQGLRAVAVVAVVVNHLTGHPRGGFVGVDVFFVISGFLITGILVRDAGREVGPLTYVGDFYRRRVRRILPAGLLTIALTLLVAHQLFAPSRFDTTVTDGGWSAVFWANWHFIDVATNYFSAGGPESPFQHYWSLAVEEQFYILWPLLLFGVTLLVGRGRSPGARRLGVGIAAGLLTVASFGYALHQSSSEPMAAYFSTLSRGWELGLGAVLACALPSLRAPRTVLTAMSWLGMAVIGVSLFLLDGTQDFPAPAALLPCLGSVLVLAGASGSVVAANPVLTNRVSGFLGDISYSVYLVHLPVIVLAESEFGSRGAHFYLCCVLLTLGLSVALYAAVERPVLRSRLLLPAARPAAVPADAAGTLRSPGAAKAAGAAGADAGPPTPRLLLGAVGLLVTGLAAYALAPSDVGSVTLPDTTAGATSDAQQAALTAELTAALGARSYPALSPSIDSVAAGPQAARQFLDCATVERAPATACVFGPSTAAHTVYLVGDSMSAVYAQALARAVPQSGGWRLKLAGAVGCPFSSDTYRTSASVQDACPAHVAAVAADIAEDRPDVLVVADSVANTTAGGAPVSATQFVADQRAELAAVRPYVGRMVLLDQPPPHDGYPACHRPGSAPAACTAGVGADRRAQSAAYAMLADQVGATFVDSTPWFCVGGRCSVFAAGVPVMSDRTSPSPAYAAHLVPVIREALLARGLLTPPAAGEPTPQLVQQLRSALGATSIGTVNESEIGRDAAIRDIWSHCGALVPGPNPCVYGAGPRRAVVVGDSTAMSWAPAVGQALGPLGYTVYNYARGQCPPVDADLNPRVLTDPAATAGCRAYNQAAPAALDQLNPSLVIVTATEGAISWLAGDATAVHFGQALADELSSIAKPGRTVIVFSPTPAGSSPETCRASGKTAADCVYRSSAQWNAMSQADATAAGQSHASYLDTSGWFCVESVCPVFVGSTPVTYDGTHMTVAYGRIIAVDIRNALLRMGVR